MKKIIAFIPVWLLYYTGHLISKTWETRFNRGGYGYDMYNTCMIRSMNLQDWAGLKGPWKPVN